MLDLASLRSSALDFAAHVAAVKAATPPPTWGWYPFPMLPGHIDVLDRLLTGPRRGLLTPGMTVADVGGADGDFAFFLESQGCDVELFEGGNDDVAELALERPMRLRDALGSSMPIHRLNFDCQFSLPKTYDLVLFLNVLYHLRNPLLALDCLAASSKHCLLATKIAGYMPASRRRPWRKKMPAHDVSIAYLLDPNEASATDPSNYWVFTESSLQRALGRCGFRVLDLLVTGNGDALPHDNPDARAWCLLESTVFDGSGTTARDLLRADHIIAPRH